MKVILHLAALTVLLGSAFGQLDSASLHNQYGEPVQEVFAVRPGFRMTVLYGLQHQICELDISSGHPDDFDSSKTTNAVLDEVVDELVPDSIRGPEKKNLIMFTGFAGGDMTDYESLTIDRTLLSGRGSSGVLHTRVTFKDRGCNGVIREREKASQ